MPDLGLARRSAVINPAVDDQAAPDAASRVGVEDGAAPKSGAVKGFRPGREVGVIFDGRRGVNPSSLSDWNLTLAVEESK